MSMGENSMARPLENIKLLSKALRWGKNVLTIKV